MTRVIDEHTSEREARFSEFRDKWLAIGLSNDAVDHPRAERAIIEAYKAAGHSPPRRIVWCASPLALAQTEANWFMDAGFGVRMSHFPVRLCNSAILDGGLKASVSDRLRTTVRQVDSVWLMVDNAIRESVRDSPKGSIGENLRYSLESRFAPRLANSIGNNWVWAEQGTNNYLYVSGHGQPDAGWIGIVDYLREVCRFREQTKALLPLMELCNSVGWCLPYRDFCWASERHTVISRDERGRLHSLTGPALAYRDDWKIYAVHGVQVPRRIIEEPETITPREIESETNVEVQKVLMEKYGIHRFPIGFAGAQIIHKDAFGILYRKRFRTDKDVVMVKVRNSTPESDGSVRYYFLRVPPRIKTARAAVAWTFGLRERQYRPDIET